MKALRFNTYGSPDVLTVEDLPMPQPAAGEVLIKVAAAAVNPSDIKNVAGLFAAALPQTPGRDFSGTVVSPGPWHGREVWGSGVGFGVSRPGAQAEYLCLPAAWLSAKPARLSMAEAATVGIPFVTAWSALIHLGRLQAGQQVLVTGSSGAIGHAAIQIAHWKGARVIGVGKPEHPNGADILVDARSADWADQLALASAGLGVDLVLDAVGGPLFEGALRSLRVGGTHIAISSAGQRRVEFDLQDFYHRQLNLIGLDTMKLGGTEIAAILDELRPGFETGALRPQPHSGHPLASARKAYASDKAAPGAGKRVIIL